MKIARTVWSGGKDGDYFKVLPITIIREMANVMLDEVKKVAPTLFKYAGPNCVNGPCKEGKMSCGKAKEMKEKYLGKKEV